MALPTLIAVKDFFADPVFSGAKISPDGTRLAYLAPQGGRTQVWVRALDEDHDRAVCVTRDARRGVKTFHWTDDPRYLVYLQDTDGNEEWHLFRVDLEAPAESAVDLTPLPPGGRVVAVQRVEWKPGHLLVAMNPRLLYFDTFLIEIATGETTVLRENDSMLGGHLYGPHGEIFWLGLADDGAWEIRTVEDDRVLARFDGPAYPVALHPVRVTPDGKGLLVGAYLDSDDLQLVRIDAATGSQTAIAGLPGRNLCTMAQVGPDLPPTIYTSEKSGEVIAARFVGDRPTIHVVDPAYTDVFDAVSALSDGVLADLSADEDEQFWVASFTNDRDPGVTYLYDRSTGQSRFLFRAYPDLDPADLAPMQPVSLTARDGLPLHGFLTLPVGVEAAGLPLVLHVHGGPWCHDSWGYDRESQLLANRGYAVLQLNFRGSSGYGKRHITSAVGELAGAMHDDLIDAAEWAVKQGYADPTRIGIYGGSYGGYASLVGVTVTPDFFAAAVDYVGISSLPNFMRTVPEFVRPTMVNNWIAYAGDPSIPEQEADMLSRSPITMVDKVKTPLLVVQGANDARVVQAEADNMVAALRARGVEVEYIIADDEGHGFQNPENLIRMWIAIERHFADHLGGRSA